MVRLRIQRNGEGRRAAAFGGGQRLRGDHRDAGAVVVGVRQIDVDLVQRDVRRGLRSSEFGATCTTYVCMPSATLSSTPVTVTVCGAFQFTSVNASVAATRRLLWVWRS